MKDFPIIWLLFNTKLGRILLGILIVYVIVSMLGWWLVPIIIALIGAILLYEYYSNLEINRIYIKTTNENRELQKQLKQKKIKEYQKMLVAHPTALKVEEVSNLYLTHHLYWLTIGKSRERTEVFENEFIKICFGIAEDRCGIIVTITNICDRTININWPSFVINRSRVHIDGVIYLDYQTYEELSPNETVTKLLQPHKLYFGGEFKEMFDLNKINEREIRYDVNFNIKCGGNEEIPMIFNVYALHKRIRIERIDDKEKLEEDKTKLIAGIGLLVLALLVTLSFLLSTNREYSRYDYHKDIGPQRLEMPVSSKVNVPNKEVSTENKDSKSSMPSSSKAYSSSYNKGNDDDNMRGFDPASEDDMDDNGMSRYIENNDEEGWD